MFENIPAQSDAKSREEMKTPAASPAEQKTAQNASEGAKTPAADETRFDQHSRFKELIVERDRYKTEATDYKSKYEALSKPEQAAARQEASAATGVAQGDIPKFTTVEELVKWVSQQTANAKEAAVSAYKAEHEAATKESEQIDQMIQGELDELAKTDAHLMSKEGREQLLQFALENELTNLKTAHNLFQKINATKEEGVKTGEQIAKRKENSGPKTTSNGTSTTKAAFRRGQSLSDVIAEAKNNLTHK